MRPPGRIFFASSVHRASRLDTSACSDHDQLIVSVAEYSGYRIAIKMVQGERAKTLIFTLRRTSRIPIAC